MIRMFVASLLLTGTALASGGTSPDPFPPPPKADLGGVPASAIVRPKGTPDKPHPVEARLLSEQSVVKAGSTVRVGLHLAQDPEWHTYWKTPGDIGLPTTISWTLPPGITAEPHIYPIPVRFEAEGMVSYGYDREVLHVAYLKLPADLKPGPITIEADADWLVCKTSCIPGNVHLATTLTVGPAAKPSPQAPLFEHYATRWPTPGEKLTSVTVRPVLSAAAVTPNSPFKIAFEIKPTAGHTLGTIDAASTWPLFVPSTGADWMVNSAKVVPTAGGVIVVVEGSTFAPDKLPTADAAGGLFQIPVDGQIVRAEISTPLPWVKDGAPAASTDPIWQAIGSAAPPAPAEPPKAAPEPPKATPDAPKVAPPADSGWSPALLVSNALLALLGGLILNVMPCVLPVLTLKLYGLVEQRDLSARDKRTAGLAYTAGILVSFWALAAAVWGARTFLGGDVGWGFQFQYPEYVAGLATVVFLFGLSLFGVFELPAIGAGSADELAGREGPMGYFFTGVFATLVATPCSAPFLGTAIAFAFQAPTALLFVIFTAIGLGLASPFLFVAFVPAAYRVLPKPGAWMEGFKQLLGFSLLATTLWLVDVLAAQIGADRAVSFLAFLLITAIGAWVFGRFGGVAASLAEQGRALVAGTLVAVAGGWMFLDLAMAAPEVCDDGAVATELSYAEHIPWQPFSEDRLGKLAGKPVFIDFTADWCVSCKVNEQTVLETAAVRERLQKHGAVALKADWTRKDPVISRWLERFERAGVPLYLVVSPKGEIEALPEVITPGMVTDALDKAVCGQTPC